MNRLLSNRTLAVSLRLFLGVMFILAAYGKLRNPGLFAHLIYNYQVLDPHVINLVAIYLPWLEVVAGAALLLGVYRRGAAALVCGMLGVFLFGLGFNIARGREFDCGCFPAVDLPAIPIVKPLLDFFVFSPEMMVTFWRDVVMLAMALIVLYTPITWRALSSPPRPPGS